MSFRRTVFALAGILAVACSPQNPDSGGNNQPGPVDPEGETVKVTSVTLSNTSLTIQVGDSETLTATVYPPNAEDVSLTWKSDNSQIATVRDGVVTGVATGTTRITAAAGGKSAVCKVTVIRKVIPVATITVSPSTVSLTEGEETTLQAEVLPMDADDRTVTWTVSPASVVTVTPNGFKATIKAVSPGNATIKATSSNGSVFGTCNVEVKEKVLPKDADFTVKVFYRCPGDNFRPEILYSDGRTATPSAWSVEGGDFVSVSSDGTVSVTGFSSSPATLVAIVEEVRTEAVIWSDVRINTGNPEPVVPSEAPPVTLSLKDAKDAVVRLVYLSGANSWASLPEGRIGSVSTADQQVATAASDGSAVKVTPVGIGDTTVSFTIGGASITLPVNVCSDFQSGGKITYPEDDYGTL